MKSNNPSRSDVEQNLHRSDAEEIEVNINRMYSGNTPESSISASSFSGSFQRRTADSARQLRDNFSSVMREIHPLVETARTVNAGVQNAITITNFLNRTTTSEHASHQNTSSTTTTTPLNRQDSIVINLEDIISTVDNDQQHSLNNSNNTIRLDHNTEDYLLTTSNNNNNNNNSEGRNSAVESGDQQTMLVETQQTLQTLLKYIPFLLIIVAKAAYDYHEGIFMLLILLTTFVHTNSAVRRETVKRHRRSLTTLIIELVYILACSVFLHFCFANHHKIDVIMNLVLIRTSFALTLGSLLWILLVTDFVLKLITVTVKILLTMLPGWIVPFKKRGKVYFFIEAVSQTYRSLVTIQPWLNFLLESYQGTEKIVAVFLSAFYMISKGTDLMSRMRMLQTASVKLLQNVTVGSAPSKEEIQTAGENCPICHDNYESPVLLECHHIFCENCVTTWFDREQTCPLCRAKIVDDPKWRDGSTSFFLQLY